jgi:large subunit ribosomal protein L25
VKLQGGLLEVITREIEIECLPDEIPESYTVDVTELMIGQNLRASEIPLGGAVKLVSGPEQVVAHVVALKAEVVETPAEGAVAATPAEPEVIKKGKKEEDEAEAEKAEKGKKK